MAFRSSKPHFFQPLMPGFEHHFSIPTTFSKYFDGGAAGGEVVKQTVTLRSPLRKHYTVTLDNGIDFKDGWKQFVDEHDLHVGDFLFFRLEQGEMLFDVMVFDPSVVERDYFTSSELENQVTPPANVSVKIEDEQLPLISVQPSTAGYALRTPREKNGSEECLQGKSGSAQPNDHHCLDYRIRPDLQARNRMNLPRWFLRENDMDCKSFEAVFVDEQGTSWQARVAHYPNHNAEVRLKRSWRKYMNKNGLKVGDSLSVELIQGGMNPIFSVTPVFSVTGPNRIPEKDLRMIVKEAKMEPKRKESADTNMSSGDNLNLEREKCSLNPDIRMSECCEPTNEKGMVEAKKEVKKKPVHEETAAAAAGAAMYRNDGTGSCMVTLTKATLKSGILFMPQEFAVESGLQGVSCSIILSNERGTPYLVTWKTSKSGKPFLGSGWDELVEVNRLRVGDVLKFELVEAGRNPVMNFKVVSSMEVL
ncbi:Putative B3 domain-containing protein REM15 [Linum perenne]